MCFYGFIIIRLGSNSDGAFDAIATFYCRKTDKPQTPSNVVSHDVIFPTTTFSSILRRFKRGKRDVANVANMFQTWQEDQTFQTWQRETLQMWQDRRFKRGKRDTLQTWQDQERRCVSNVAIETLQTWQVRRCKRGK
jgi:hypothetical protein